MERLADRAVLRAAPLRVEGTGRGVPLGRFAPGGAALGGTLDLRLGVGGTLASPEAALDLSARQVTVEGRLLGDADVALRSLHGSAGGEATITGRDGGRLVANAALLVAVKDEGEAKTALAKGADAVLLNNEIVKEIRNA